MNRDEFRSSVLAAFGAGAAEIAELLAYNENVFDLDGLQLAGIPLAPEPHISTWEEYVAEAKAIGGFESLKKRLVQLQFPVQAEISQSSAYQAATRKGKSADNMLEATGLVLQQPKQLQIQIYQSLAGAIPIITVKHRADFVSLVRALTLRNEPKPVPDSMGACIVAGFNNWDRVRRYRQQWADINPTHCSDRDWVEEFQRLIPQKQLYQDRFIIVSDGGYSGISASEMGLTEIEWRQISMQIRLEHECTHYFTRRVFGSMRNNLLDEAIADYRGIIAACGRYRADWCLRFFGLEKFPAYRPGGRLQNYLGQPPLSARAFQILCQLIKAVAKNLEEFDSAYAQELNNPNTQSLMLVVLSGLTIEELASKEANLLLQKRLERLDRRPV